LRLVRLLGRVPGRNERRSAEEAETEHQHHFDVPEHFHFALLGDPPTAGR
jgi:hypothetical protein